MNPEDVVNTDELVSPVNNTVPVTPPPEEEDFDPFANLADPTVDPFQLKDFPSKAEPFEEAPRRRGNSIDAPGGVTIKVGGNNGPPVANTPKVRDVTPKSDPLSFLANAKEGRIKIRRIPSPMINTQGYYKTESGEKVKVGVGECGFMPICNSEELLDSLKCIYGGGRFELTHLDQNDKKVSVGIVDLPQIPKPLEGVVEEENEFDDAPVGVQPLGEEYDPFAERSRRGRPYIPGYPPGMGGMQHGMDPMSPYQRPRPPVINTWRPSEEAEKAQKEVETLKSKLDQERQEREKAEKERLQDKHANELRLLKLQIEETTKQVSTAKSSEAVVLKAELEGFKREFERLTRESSQPKSDPLVAMFQMMKVQQDEAARRWEQDKEEQRRKDEKEKEEKRRQEAEERTRREEDRRREEERAKREWDERIRQEAEERRKEDQRRDELRQAEEKRREEERRREEQRREEEKERREEERRLREEERRKEETRLAEERRREELRLSEEREKERTRREEERNQREEERRREEQRLIDERRREDLRLQEERERRAEELRRVELREQREAEERRLERERQERKEEERKREQQEFMRLMFDQQKASAQQINPLAMVKDVLALADEIKDLKQGGGGEEEESAGATIAKTIAPVAAAMLGHLASQQPQQPPPVQAPPVQVIQQIPTNPPQVSRPTPQTAQPRPPVNLMEQKAQMVRQYSEMLRTAITAHKEQKTPQEAAVLVTTKAAEIGARKNLDMLKGQTLDSLQGFITMAIPMVGGMDRTTLEDFVAVIKTPEGSSWVTELLKCL